MINLIRNENVSPLESHFEIEINGKIVQFAKWQDMDWMIDYEIFNGKELLNENEEEEVLEFIDEAII